MHRTRRVFSPTGASTIERRKHEIVEDRDPGRVVDAPSHGSSALGPNVQTRY